MDANNSTIPIQKRIPILPRSGLYLTSGGQEEGRRFARIFREVWRSLPLGDRRLLLRYWRSDTVLPGSDPSPHIFLVHDFGLTRSSRPHAIACCTGMGTRLYFHAKIMARMPDQHAAEVIAHELGHVYLWILGASTRGAVGEIRADKVMRHWGYDPHANTAWYQLNVQGWSKKTGPIWREQPATREEVSDKLWDPRFPNWHARYLKRNGMTAWDDWEVPTSRKTRKNRRANPH